MRQVIHCWGAARDPNIHKLFQMADVVAGVTRRVNADLVLPPKLPRNHNPSGNPTAQL